MYQPVPVGTLPPLGEVPDTMYAQVVRADRFGDPRAAFQIEEVEVPPLKPREVLIASMAGLTLQQQAWIGVCAVLGHLFPLYFRFRGGKGVATAAGMLLGIYPPAALLAVLAWLLTFYLTRTSSLAALIATPLTLPLLAWQEPAALLPMSVLTLLIVWRHRGNLRDLFAGRERHF